MKRPIKTEFRRRTHVVDEFGQIRRRVFIHSRRISTTGPVLCQAAMKGGHDQRAS